MPQPSQDARKINQVQKKKKSVNGLKVNEVARRLNLSSEAVVSILKELGFPPRGYTALVTFDEFNKVKEKVKQEKTLFKESLKKKTVSEVKTAPATKLSVTEIDVKKAVKKTLTKIEHREVKPKRHIVKTIPTISEPQERKIKVAPYLSVAELAHLFNVPVNEVIKKCIGFGLLATVNHRLDPETITLLADEFGIKVEIEEETIQPTEIKGELLERPPVVVVMGHVDHGKTSLLDYIRKTKVAEKEPGKITQHTGAYVVNYNNKRITFLDTPGHVAFTAMRARGAQITDIAVLVVAADDGVMPQTIEALNHARAAGIPIIVAITKCDLPNTNPEVVKTQLSKQGIRIEEYGGDTMCVLTSVRTGMGIEDLLEAILLLSEELKLQAVYEGNASGVVIESRVDKGRGNVVTVLIQQGTLKRGDIFVCGEFYGRARDLLNENFHRLDRATPSTPVLVLGCSGLPEAGDRFEVVNDERTARDIAMRRALAKRDMRLKHKTPVSLQQLQQKIAEGKTKEMKIVLKADTFGSAEALKDALEGLSIEEVVIRVIHAGIGQITSSDVLLAQASEAIIVGYHVTALADAAEIAEREGVEIRYYNVIYSALDDIRSAMLGLLEPEQKEVLIGKGVIRQVFMIPRVGPVAGVYVTEGKVTRTCLVKVMRDGKEVLKSRISSLKRFKDDVKEVESGYECGIGIENATDLQPEDILEFYKIEEVVRTIESSLTPKE
ncbi:MAG: translation initiation factor IF-2 [candidate division WOR-3 bacterium]|nr:translation initiation factor IF-2 [candidate division WOR-3 bacterium]